MDVKYGKKLCNKYTPRWSSDTWKIKAINGSMITVESNGKQVTRNSIYFKKAPDGLYEDLSDFDVIPNVCVGQTKVVGRSDLVTDQLNLDNVVADGGANASQEEVVNLRRTGRDRKQVERFVAGPASGLIHREPKSSNK